eukprot:snap_masked-scaffold_4-processed-gene-19.20-mRNA-1 protein AED:1.00 eAED:1.00 QI:0/-1/0/0/-1/1/1/0/404
MTEQKDDEMCISSQEHQNMALNVTIVSYNILCSALADKERQKKTKKELLLPETRYPKVVKILEQCIDQQESPIICLQEVSRSWSPDLKSFFEQKGYTPYFKGYGKEKSDGMGVLLAVPSSFTVVMVKAPRISDTVLWPDDKEVFGLGYLKGYSEKMLKSILNARSCLNHCIWVQLQKGGKQFCFATYHMPAMNEDKVLMNIHAGLFLRYSQRMCEGLPLAVAGDFNIKPTQTGTYYHITSGDWSDASPLGHLLENETDILDDDIDAENQVISEEMHVEICEIERKFMEEIYRSVKDNPKVKAVEEHRLLVAPSRMYSSYKVLKGVEAPFTQMSFRKKDPGRRKKGKNNIKKVYNCVDYIFFFGFDDVLDVRDMQECRERAEHANYPNADEPSDHLWVGCTLLLK